MRQANGSAYLGLRLDSVDDESHGQLDRGDLGLHQWRGHVVARQELRLRVLGS